MVILDRQSTSLKRRIHRLVGSRVELTWIRGSELDPVLGELDWVEQIILEMALRARAALPYGGRLVVESANLELDDLCGASEGLTAGRYVMFEMTCLRHSPTAGLEGRPLPYTPEFASDLFLEPFWGDSLGILQALGGNLCEYNEPGRSLTLRAFFPSAAKVIYSDEDYYQVDSICPETILLVEDEGYVREVACEILESAGYTVLPAVSGKEALAVFEKHGPVKLLLTDVVMPGMNGRDLAQALTERQPGLKTIYMSGYNDKSIFRRDIDPREVVYIQKPFTLETLTTKVKEVLSTV
ncbi:MAG TPA: response regulator [Terriglobales bacterium]|nr:response regulator [Terriglobales bacterium]